MAVNLSPVGNAFQFFSNLGIPLAGGKIYTYQAGSSTPLATYSDNGGVYPNANPIVLGVDGRPADEIWLLNGYNYKFVLKDADDVTIQTYDNLYGIIGTQSAVGTTIPTGMISLWYGATGSVPVGWYLCDGTNGTPDLRDRFIVGAGSSYAVNATGGSKDAIVVSHTHTASVTDPGHNHSYSLTNYTNYSSGGVDPVGRSETTTNTGTSTTGISVTVNSAGSSGTNANLPPYYALAYVMKA